MIVANPIYDSVFKYLLEDNEIAKILISIILNLKIKELHLEPTEVISTIDGIRDFTVFRIDFKATITIEKGVKKVVLIEIQKAKLQSDILRFRKYLAHQYMDDKNTVTNKNVKKALPIYTIYFLGHKLKHIHDAPIINVSREYINNYNKEKITQKEEFIESLTHDSVIIQIPLFKTYKRNKLEKLLAIFESSTNHTVNVEDIDDPDYKRITRRLLAATADNQIQIQMNLEDEILEELANNLRAIEKAEQKTKRAEKKAEIAELKAEEAELKAEEAEFKADQAIQKEQEAKLKEQEAIQKVQEALQKEQEAIQKEQEVIFKLKNSIHLLFTAGVSKELIAQNLQISIAEVDKFLLS